VEEYAEYDSYGISCPVLLRANDTGAKPQPRNGYLLRHHCIHYDGRNRRDDGDEESSTYITSPQTNKPHDVSIGGFFHIFA
jgi:hypothetical protein